MRRGLVFAVLILLAAHNASAQQPSKRLRDTPLVSSATAMATNAGLSVIPPVQGSRDSLKNGVVIGAIVGGVLASAFGAGAGVGVGIDALNSRAGPRVVLRVRF